MVSKSRKHANTVKLDAVVSKAIEKAVDMRKVAALSAGAASVIAGAAIAFGATPAMAAETPASAPVNTNDPTKEQNLVAKKNAEAEGSKDSDKTATETTKKDDASKIEDSKKAEPSAAKNDQADKKVATDKNVAETQDNKSKTEQNLTSSKNASVQSVVKTDGKKQIENNAEQKKIAEQNTASTEYVDSKTTTNKTPATDKTNTTSSATAKNNAPAENVAKKSRTKRSLDENKQPETPASTVAQGEDRAGTEHNPDEVVFSQNLPNIYGWATPSNTFDTQLEKQKVVYHLPKSADGKPVVRVVILPDSKDSINTDDPEAYKKIIEFDSNRVDEMHQSYSGIYELKTNTDGSVDLIMQQPFRDGGISSGQGYCANRSIFLYYDKDNLQHDQTSNNFRVATLVPPKTAGSIVLKYDERLSADKVREVLHNAVNLPTEHKSGSSVADQLVAQSKSAGVGLRVDESTVNNTPDTVDAKIPQGMGSYDGAMFGEINKTNDSGDYSFGERKLKTYLVTDLGMKSPEIPLTVVRYSTRIEKPVVDTVDFSKLTEDQKTQIRKNLAKLNGVSTDKVTFDNNGNATIDFDGLSPQDDPKIPLSDLVLTRVSTDKVAIPSDSENSKVKAVVVANPLGYSQAELKQIKKAIYEANKDNQELGLSAKDYEKQISLGWLTGDTTASGGQNTGISNGMNENKITVTIRTDKAYAQFESDIQKHELTRLIDLRKDYTLSWDASNNKISGRTSDEGLAWMEEGKTLVYRYDPDKGEQINTKAVLGLLKATVKSDVKTDNPQLRENLLGTEIDTVKREGSNGQARRTHRSYTVDDKGEPIGVLNLVKLNGSSYGGFAKPVDNSNKKMGDEQSSVGDFTFDDDSKKVNVAGKTGKFMLGRLFIEPYSLYYYNYVYGENKYNLRNTPKGINVVFVPQTNHKKDDLSKSIGDYKLAADKKTPTESKYYNASAEKKDAYDKALDAAKKTLEKVGNKTDADLTEELKAEVDNATITLNKAREALDGDATKKEELNKSIDEDGTPAQGQQATTGTKASDKYKNVTEPDFKDANGNTDTTKNEAAKKAKTAYDDALTEANKVKEDKNATQKAVDDAKAKLDAARKELDKYTTNKDKLNAAIAEHGQVNTGKNDQGAQDVTKADPTYQNSNETERKAYDEAVKKANELSKDPNASQKDVNKAIEDLKKAKDALDKNATDKSPLDAAVQKSFDNPDPNDDSKQSVFYKNAKNKTNDTAAQQAVKNYDDALKKAKDVLANDKATKKDVEDAKKALEAAETALHSDKYSTDKTDLGKALADNFSGYLMPAYFNAFDKAQADGQDSQAAKDFKAYNDAYHAAKDLMTELNKPNSTVTQDEVNKVKDQLIAARKIIDTYATDTSKLSAAAFNDIAIKFSPAYQNLKALAEKENPSEAEKADVEAAKKAKQAYDDAAEKLHKAITNTLPKDQANGHDIPDNIIPKEDGDPNDKDYLKGIQAHKNGEPLNRDVDTILKEMNEAAKALDKFATKTDKLQESINKDTDTQHDPAYKNAKDPHKLGTDGNEDTSGYADIKQKATDYDEALADAKKLLTDPTATQAQVDAALKKLDEKRDALKAQDTNVEALKKSVDKNGKDAEGANPAVEGTKDSDAYRNASDPHFLTADGKPDDTRNNAAKEAKKAYDKALAEAQELLSKHDDTKTPLDAKPTQKQIDDALTELDTARKTLEDTYKTDTSKLSTEADLSKADAEGSSIDGKFENSPEFKNADAKKDGTSDNEDVKAYKDALKAARDLVKAATDTNKKPSERPTQKQVDEALEALKKAKQTITDGYKTNLDALTAAKDYANGDFKKTPEYKNAKAINDDQNADQDKKSSAKSAIDALDDTVTDSALKKAKDIIDNPTGKTQQEVDEALKTLQAAMDTVTNGYKTVVDPLEKEVGDKDATGKPVTPPFEESIPYKNALYKKQSETGNDATADTSATKKLQDYNEKFKAAQDLINKVKNPDPNADPDKKPTNADVKKALEALQKAKKAIDDAFTTNAKDLKDESAKSTADGGTVADADFEATTEFKNADSKKAEDGKSDNADISAYKEALKKARTLLEKFGDDGKPKSDVTDVPSQKEVDEALQKLKEIKDKIIADYKTSSTELQQEFDKSKDGDNDKRDEVFENTPAFKNAQAKGDEDSKKALEEYNEKLKAAKKLLDAFDRTTGKPKTKLPEGMDKAPTQKQLYDALDALQAAKKKITEGYKTDKSDLNTEAGKDSDFTKSPEYQNAAGSPEAEAYKRALDEANAVLKNPNATQAEVDEALKKLQDAKQKLTDSHKTDKSDLNTEADNDPDFRKSIPFIIGKAADLAEYQQALNDANSVLKDPNATQAQVDQALRRLRDAKQKLIDAYNRLINSGSGVGDNTGVGVNDVNTTSVNNVVDKSVLQSEVDQALGDVSANANGVVADSNLVSEFNAALNYARLVLADANATQGQVDSALARLRAARAALRAGMLAARDSAGMNIKRGDVSGVNTGASSSVFAALAAVFAGLGVAGAASNRRKHSAR
ncbi:FIVAR domain-containing protein [Gardnerella vaginalis]|uniref:FIVAR domain-containing protein n=1 Tax=Gardnerella vaginalis TaxID=2702 RepID=UPI0002634D0B|nr:FIVAR domain-containing protein [Gardnerella vaginalis]EIK74690.1 ebhA protein [Gardnerella vaginalis 75712]